MILLQGLGSEVLCWIHAVEKVMISRPGLQTQRLASRTNDRLTDSKIAQKQEVR